MSQVNNGVHFKKLSSGRYQVWAHTGHLLGEVWKYEKRYNLRRVYVIRSWHAEDTKGVTVGVFDTRREAVEALHRLRVTAPLGLTEEGQ